MGGAADAVTVSTTLPPLTSSPRDPAPILRTLWPNIIGKRLHVTGTRSVAGSLRSARSRCGIYVLSFADGEFYVGRTFNFAGRFLDHRKKWDDITEVLVLRMAKRDQVAAERAAIWRLEDDGFLLRNAIDVVEIHGPTAFDEIIKPDDQKRWLASALSDDPGDEVRLDRPDQRRRNRTNLARLVADPRFADLLPGLRRYITTTVPFSRRTELDRWAISAVPGVNRNSWPRLLTLTIHSLETLYVFAPIREPGRTMITINVDLPTILARWGTLDRLMNAFDGVTAEESLYGVRRGVLALRVESAPDLIRLLDLPGVTDAARQLNLQLMRKGPCFQRRVHSFGLADMLLEPLHQRQI